MFKKVFSRNSIDDRGMRIDSTVHYGDCYDNAFWNGRQMVYGDGDGRIFAPFTKALDVIGHELTHGITQCEAGLNYRGQPGALNESFSDVFGCLVKQYRRRQTAKEADWLIGEDLFLPGVKAKAIRSMKAPGTAYDDPVLGKDPQPGHMDDYVVTEEDNGGVHLNSGIPNRAFYELAMRLKGIRLGKSGTDLVQNPDRKTAPGIEIPRRHDDDALRPPPSCTASTASSRKPCGKPGPKSGYKNARIHAGRIRRCMNSSTSIS